MNPDNKLKCFNAQLLHYLLPEQQQQQQTERENVTVGAKQGNKAA